MPWRHWESSGPGREAIAFSRHLGTSPSRAASASAPGEGVWLPGTRAGLQGLPSLACSAGTRQLLLEIVSFFLSFFFFFLAALGLRCYARGFSSCGERGLLFVAVRGLLIAVASLVAEHGL